MNKLYFISNFINTNQLPKPSSMEYLIASDAYLFRAYSDNYLLLKAYMRFIDANFENAFTNLNYQIVECEYPDYIDYGSREMTHYINSMYNDKYNHQFPALVREYELESYKSFDYYYNNKPMDVLMNSFLLYDSTILNGSLFEKSLEPFIEFSLFKYIKDKNIRNTIEHFTHLFELYYSQLSYAAHCMTERYSPNMIDDALLSICQVKLYLYNKRGDFD